MKEILKNKKILIIGGIVLLIIIIGVIILTANLFSSKNSTSYNEIVNMINNKKDVLIFYYNSKSNNIYNDRVLKNLDDNNIKYCIYDDKNITEEEKDKFLELLKIDKKIFGFPALIYIRDGEMYGNLINIDNMEVVDKFVKNYDLFVLK